MQRFTTTNEVWYRTASTATSWYPWHQMALLEDIGSGDGSGLAQDTDGVWYITEGADEEGPQPAAQRVVTEDRALSVLGSVAVTSDSIRRIRISTNASEPLENGDLLIVIGG